MDLSPQIKKALDSLLQQQDFLDDIQSYTTSALQTIHGLPQTQDIDTPPPFIFALSHAQRTNSFPQLLASLPPNTASKIRTLYNKFISQHSENRVDNSLLNNLSDVSWQMWIEKGREVFEVRLVTEEGKPFIMRLNYQQLSVLSFQVAQLVSRVSQMADEK